MVMEGSLLCNVLWVPDIFYVSMTRYEVVTLPPHNSDTPHGLVAGNTHTSPTKVYGRSTTRPGTTGPSALARQGLHPLT